MTIHRLGDIEFRAHVLQPCLSTCDFLSNCINSPKLEVMGRRKSSCHAMKNNDLMKYANYIKEHNIVVGPCKVLTSTSRLLQ